MCSKHGRTMFDCILKAISLSVCGKFVLAKTAKDVEVLPIPENMLASTTLHCIVNGDRAASGQGSETELPQGTSNMLSIFNSQLPPSGVLSGPILLSYDKSSNANDTKALIVTTSNNELRLESVGTPSSRTTETGYLQLLTLPESFDTSNTAICLRLPTGSSDSLKIIFNKTASEEYSLSDGREGQFPKIVERENSSVAQVFGPNPAEETGEWPSNSCQI
jgi:hypothetical protein